MIGELLINGKDTYNEFGISMGDGFLDTLSGKAGLEEHITNNGHTKNDIEYCKSTPEMNERVLALTFTIMSNSQADFINKKDLFCEELSKGDMALSVPKNSAKTYHLKFKDITGMYA